MQNPNFSSFMNYLAVFLDRTGSWFLYGKALAHFVCSGEFDDCKIIKFGLLDVDDVNIEQRMGMFNIIPSKKYDGVYEFIRDGYQVEIHIFRHLRKSVYECNGVQVDKKYLVCDPSEVEEIRHKHKELNVNGMWRRQISELFPQYVYLPYCYGTVLDLTEPNWFIDTPKRPYPTTGEIFFDEERKKNGRQLITKLYESADKAGIADRLFAGFGTCLGYLMYGDYIPKDRDMDMCILSDGMTIEQFKTYAEHAYNVDVVKPSRWEVSRRSDDGFYWFSVGYKNPAMESGCKSCNWFMFNWNGYWWHSKGGRWVNPRKINSDIGYKDTDEAIALGQLENTIPKLVEVDFKGTKMMIPSNPGMCCDHWYPGWGPKGDGASAHRYVAIIKDWKDRDSWRIA